MKKLTQEEVILRFIQKHAARYDYSKVIYLGMFIKVIIICPIHGEFLQTPNDHLNGAGCSKCKSCKIGNQFRFNIEEFIEKARTVHGYFYDYSNVNYINALTKVSIICPIHGKFNQTPASHLSGCGCPKCKFIYLNNLLKSNLEEFIKKAQAIHNGKYDYSLAIYTTAKSKIIIICPFHGEFTQTPNDHLSGRGCPRCQKSKGELAIIEILKKHNINFQDEYKLPEIVSNYEYDFYLPEYNILIEFHGIQHYEYVPFLHDYNEDNFLRQKDRDNVKKDNAYTFKYKYLEFNYRHLKELSKEQFEQLVINKIKH